MMGILHNANELRDALQMIRSECEAHKDTCCSCPLQTKAGHIDVCGVSGVNVNAHGKYVYKPQYWQIAPISLFIPGESKEDK